MINIKPKSLILSFFFLLSGCISVSDIMNKDETGVEPIDEVGQLLSDIQEEENTTLPEIDEEPALEVSEEKLDPTPTQEYDSVLLDQKPEEESSEEVVEPVAVETAENEETEAGKFPEDDDLVLLPETTDYDEEPVYEVYDEDEGWVEISEEEFEQILEIEAEKDAKELEILETYDLEELEDLNLYIPEDEYEDLTEEEIKQIEKEFEEFIETVLVVEEYLESLEDDFEFEPVIILI